LFFVRMAMATPNLTILFSKRNSRLRQLPGIGRRL
jgi:hypothetical protein